MYRNNLVEDFDLFKCNLSLDTRKEVRSSVEYHYLCMVVDYMVVAYNKDEYKNISVPIKATTDNLSDIIKTYQLEDEKSIFQSYRIMRTLHGDQDNNVFGSPQFLKYVDHLVKCQIDDINKKSSMKFDVGTAIELSNAIKHPFDWDLVENAATDICNSKLDAYLSKLDQKTTNLDNNLILDDFTYMALLSKKKNWAKCISCGARKNWTTRIVVLRPCAHHYCEKCFDILKKETDINDECPSCSSFIVKVIETFMVDFQFPADLNIKAAVDELIELNDLHMKETDFIFPVCHRYGSPYDSLTINSRELLKLLDLTADSLNFNLLHGLLLDSHINIISNYFTSLRKPEGDARYLFDLNNPELIDSEDALSKVPEFDVFKKNPAKFSACLLRWGRYYIVEGICESASFS